MIQARTIQAQRFRPNDSGPTRFRPDTIQANDAKKFWSRFRPDLIQACHDSGQLDTIQAHSVRIRPVMIQAHHDSGPLRFRPITIQAGHSSGHITQARSPDTIQVSHDSGPLCTIQARHDSGPSLNHNRSKPQCRSLLGSRAELG